MFDNVDEGHPEGEKTVKYYYNREERIANAPEIVKKYYRGDMKPVRGIKIFFTGSNKYILFALIFFVGVAWIYSGFNKSRNYAKIQGLDFEVVSYSFEDQIYSSVSVKWNPKADGKNKGDRNITAEIFLIDGDKQVVNKDIQSITYTADDAETKYMRVRHTDFDIIRCDVILTVNDEEKEISTVVKR